MRSFRIDTPSGQNWSCHGCTACCRGGMYISLSGEEKHRIEGQGWSKADGVDPASMIVEEGSTLRLGHQPDGACVFLEDSGRCRIHSRFGEEAKPKACRLFPLALHPAGKKLVAGLRFSCPSAAANSGKPLSDQLPELRKLADLIVPAAFSEIAPPPVFRTPGLDWPDFLRFVTWLDKIMADPAKPVAFKLQQALQWLREIEKARFDQVSGAGADEILAALSQSAAETTLLKPQASPTRFGNLLFRTLIFVYARKDTVADLHADSRHRARALWAMLRFARAAGTIPPLRADMPPIAFKALEASFGPLPSEAEAMLSRFFRVKIQSLHFCGRACYDLPLIEGFQSLALLFPVILWLARWHAASQEKSSLRAADIAFGITVADHHHGYSPALGTTTARQRVRLLAQKDDIARLCHWLSR